LHFLQIPVVSCYVDLLVGFMVFNATFLKLYRGGQFYWWMKAEYPEKITDLSQVTDKLIT